MPPGTRAAEGQLPEVNSATISAQITLAGGVPRPPGIAPDDPVETRELFELALEADVVVSSGGVSVGELALRVVVGRYEIEHDLNAVAVR